MKFSRRDIKIFLSAFLLRVVLVVISSYLDERFNVKYTDVDYFVFSGASKYVLEGKSPYLRSTYRYTPILSYLLVLNFLVHPCVGKIMFCVVDIVCGMLTYEMTNSMAITCVTILFNPILVNVSTRGNADQIVVLFVILALYFLRKKKKSIFLSSLSYGFAVHFKIYPVIYFPTIFLYLKSWKNRFFYMLWSGLLNLFFLIIFYYLYGFEFLYESYLYHLVRSDNRHNFSVYFYSIYLNTIEKNSVISLLMFLPQAVILLMFALKYHRDDATMYKGFFLQTLTFVCFNKVCTVQYFIWYISLLSLVLPFMKSFSKLGLSIMFILWMAGQLLWLNFAYKLEFLGENTFFEIWIAGIIFFLVNIGIMTFFIITPTKTRTKED